MNMLKKGQVGPTDQLQFYFAVTITAFQQKVDAILTLVQKLQISVILKAKKPCNKDQIIF